MPTSRGAFLMGVWRRRHGGAARSRARADPTPEKYRRRRRAVADSGGAASSLARDARGGDHLGNGAGVLWRHDVGTGNARRLLELLQQLDADLGALALGVGGALETLDDRLGHDRAEKLLAHPPRRARRGDGCDANENASALGQAELDEPRGIAAHDSDIHAELRLHEFRAR